MNNLDKIIQHQLNGSEKLSFNGKGIGFTISDFWKWSSSDILSNATRGILAEFIVRSAIKTDFSCIRNEWDPYDILTLEGIKIEVKSAAYIQSWKQEKYSKISFSIKPTSSLNDESTDKNKQPIRQSDIYAFCLLKEKDQTKINPLNLEQWDFYLVQTKVINKLLNFKKSLGLNSLKSITRPIDYSNISQELKKIL